MFKINMGKHKNNKKQKKDNDIDKLLNDAIKENNKIKPSTVNVSFKKKIKIDKRYNNYPNVSICIPTFTH